MKKLLYRLFPSLFLVALPAAALAQTTVTTNSLIRFQQYDVPGFDKRTAAPATVFLGLDSDKLADGKLSLHLYGWGQVELADKVNNDTQSDASLTYGYLQYRFGYANAQARAGRFFVYDGIVNEQIDGVSARTDLPYGFTISAFGGAPVHTTSIPHLGNDGKGDGIMGGRVSYRRAGLLELGVAGVYESPAAPSLGPPALVPFGAHRLVGTDLWLHPLQMVQLSGQTSYNTETEKVAEHSYLLQITPLAQFNMGLTYDQHNDRDYFYASPLFSTMVRNLNQESRAFGGSATYSFKNAQLSGDFKHYKRDIGKAERFGGDVKSSFKDNEVRAGFSYHYLRSSGDFAIIPAASASGSFHELRGWAMHDTKTYFASLDAIAYIFKQEIDNRKSAWEGEAVLGYHLTPDLAVSGDLSYGQNPDYNNELKGLIRVTYNLTLAKGGSK